MHHIARNGVELSIISPLEIKCTRERGCWFAPSALLFHNFVRNQRGSLCRWARCICNKVSEWPSSSPFDTSLGWICQKLRTRGPSVNLISEALSKQRMQFTWDSNLDAEKVALGGCNMQVLAQNLFFCALWIWADRREISAGTKGWVQMPNAAVSHAARISACDIEWDKKWASQ